MPDNQRASADFQTAFGRAWKDMGDQSPYDVLGVDPKMSVEQIREKFQDVAGALQERAVAGDESAVAELVRTQAAGALLLTPGNKRQIDNLLAEFPDPLENDKIRAAHEAWHNPSAANALDKPETLGASAAADAEGFRAYETRLQAQIQMTGGNPYGAIGVEENASQRAISEGILNLRNEGQLNLANAVEQLIGEDPARVKFNTWATQSQSPLSPFANAEDASAEMGGAFERAAVPPAVLSRTAALRERLSAAKNATVEAFNALAERMSDDIAPNAQGVPRTLTISDKEVGTGYEAGANGYSILLPDARIVPAVWNEAKEGKPGFWQYEDPDAPGAKPSVSLGQRLSGARDRVNQFGSDTRERLSGLSSDLGERLATLRNGAIDVTLDHVAMPQPVRERVLSRFMPADNKEGFSKVEISAEALMSRGDESITQHADDFKGLKGRMDLLKPQSGFADLTEVSFNAENGTFSVANAEEGARIAAVAATKGKIAVWLPDEQVQALQGYATAQNENATAQVKAATHAKFAATFGDELKTVEGDPYKTLGVSHDATQAEIDAAHKEMQTRVSKLKANIQPHDQLGLAQTYDDIQKGVTAKADAAYELVGTAKARAGFNHFAVESGSELVSPTLDTVALKNSMAQAAEIAPNAAENEHAMTSGIGRAYALAGLMVKGKEIREQGGPTLNDGVSVILDTVALKNPSTAIAAQAFGVGVSMKKGYEQDGVTGLSVEGGRAAGQTLVSAELLTPGAAKATIEAVPTAIKSIPAALKNAPQAVKAYTTTIKGVTPTQIVKGTYNLLTKEGALAEAATNLMQKSSTLVSSGNLAKGLTRSAGFAGDMGLAQSFVDTTSDTIGYLRHTKELDMDSYTQTAITAVTDLDPLRVATFGLTSTDKLVGKTEGYGHKSIGDTIKEIQQMQGAEETRFADVDARDIYRNRKKLIENPDNAPALNDYRIVGAVSAQIKKFVPDGEIDGHDIGQMKELRQVDFSKKENRQAYSRALAAAVNEQRDIMEQNQSIAPSFLRFGEGAEKYETAKSQYNMLTQAQTEFADFNKRTNHYNNAVIAQQQAAAAQQADGQQPAAGTADASQAADGTTATTATTKPTTTNPATATVSDDKDKAKDDTGKKKSWLDDMRDMGGIMGFIAMIITAIFSLFGGNQQADSTNPPAAGGQNTAASAGDDKVARKPEAALTPEQQAEAKKHMNTATGGQTQGQGADANHAAPVVPGTTSAGTLAQNSGQNVP